MNQNEPAIIAVIHDFYGIISGRAGENRNWISFRRLFFSNARLTPHKFDDDGTSKTISFDVETYIKHLEMYLSENNFFEEGIIHKIDIHCNTAQVDSSYIAKKDLGDTEPLKRGRNYIQLLNDGVSWKIVSMLWENE